VEKKKRKMAETDKREALLGYPEKKVADPYPGGGVEVVRS
jgi:hypothetical protein